MRLSLGDALKKHGADSQDHPTCMPVRGQNSYTKQQYAICLRLAASHSSLRRIFTLLGDQDILGSDIVYLHFTSPNTDFDNIRLPNWRLSYSPPRTQHRPSHPRHIYLSRLLHRTLNDHRRCQRLAHRCDRCEG